MKKVSVLLIMALAMTACKDSGKEGDKLNEETMDQDNPLLADSDLPYYAPDFSKIKEEHFQPAMMEGIKQQKEAIEEIANSTEEPSFENTVLALEKSGETLGRARRVFGALT